MGVLKGARAATVGSAAACIVAGHVGEDSGIPFGLYHTVVFACYGAKYQLLLTPQPGR